MRKMGFIALLLIAGLWACEYDTLDPKEIELPDVIYFATDLAPVFEANCSTCHSGALSPSFKATDSYGALVNGGYVDTNNPEESKLIVKISIPHPSNDPLSLTEKAMILKWIEDGAKNN
jgi:hypothetical protein